MEATRANEKRERERGRENHIIEAKRMPAQLSDDASADEIVQLAAARHERNKFAKAVQSNTLSSLSISRLTLVYAIVSYALSLTHHTSSPRYDAVGDMNKICTICIFCSCRPPAS